jgi:hypothetical protein
VLCWAIWPFFYQCRCTKFRFLLLPLFCYHRQSSISLLIYILLHWCFNFHKFKSQKWNFRVKRLWGCVLNNYWAGRMAQVVKCLPSKHDPLSSNPNTTKKKKWELNNYWEIIFFKSQFTFILMTYNVDVPESSPALNF